MEYLIDLESIINLPLQCLLVDFSEEFSRNYCVSDIVNIDCGYSSAIVITSARYGRMEADLCQGVNDDLGCFDDVIDKISLECTGKQQCEIPNIVRLLKGRRPSCVFKLQVYLATTHICVNGKGCLLLTWASVGGGERAKMSKMT